MTFNKFPKISDNQLVKCTIDPELRMLGHRDTPVVVSDPKEVRARRASVPKGKRGVSRWTVWDVPDADDFMEHHGTLLARLLWLDQARFRGSSFRSLFDRSYQLMMTCRFDDRDNRKELAWGEMGFEGPANEELMVIAATVHCAQVFIDMNFEDIHPCHTMDGRGRSVAIGTLRRTCEWMVESQMLCIPPTDLRARWLVEGLYRWLPAMPEYREVPDAVGHICDELVTNIGGGTEEFVSAFLKRNLPMKRYAALRQEIETENGRE